MSVIFPPLQSSRFLSILKAQNSNFSISYHEYSRGCLPLEINYAVLTGSDNENKKHFFPPSWIPIKIVGKLKTE